MYLNPQKFFELSFSCLYITLTLFMSKTIGRQIEINLIFSNVFDALTISAALHEKN